MPLDLLEHTDTLAVRGWQIVRTNEPEASAPLLVDQLVDRSDEARVLRIGGVHDGPDHRGLPGSDRYGVLLLVGDDGDDRGQDARHWPRIVIWQVDVVADADDQGAATSRPAL